MRTYEDRQRMNREERDARVDEVYSRIPRMKELDESRGSIAMELVKKGDSENIGAAFEKIRSERARLLAEAGFPADYMEMKYVCNDCRDTGYVDGAKCHCLTAKEIELLYAQSNIKKVLEKENFGTLNADVYSEPEHMNKVVTYCRRFVDSFDEKHQSAVFTGSTGTGKTFLCNCIARALMDTNHSVIYLTAIELFDAMAQAKIKDDREMQIICEQIQNCDLLVIDDLGSEFTNSMTEANLFYIVNLRLQKGLATIISTNLSLETMRDIYTERVSSRVKSNYDVIPFTGDDIRLR